MIMCKDVRTGACNSTVDVTIRASKVKNIMGLLLPML